MTPKNAQTLRSLLIEAQGLISGVEDTLKSLEVAATTLRRSRHLIREAEDVLKDCSQPTNQPTEPPVDWDRWHELLDIRDKRPLRTSELEEYAKYGRIVRERDIVEGKAADAALGKLAKEHERILASIRRLTAAVLADAKQPAPPPVEVKMWLKQLGRNCCTWECSLGRWQLQLPPVSYSRPTVAEDDAKASLTALGKRLGVKLIPKWVKAPDSSVVDMPTNQSSEPAVHAEQRNPPVEVEMRVRRVADGASEWMWEARFGKTTWLQPSAIEERQWYGSPELASYLAEQAGNEWLAALSKQLGRKLVAKWEENT